MGRVIDWKLAQQIATFVAGEANGAGAVRAGEAAGAFAALPDVAVRSARMVSGYTSLVPSGELPAPEALSRALWIEANMRSIRALLEPATERVGEQLGPLAPPLRAAAG